MGGGIVYYPVMVNDLNAELGRIARGRVPQIRVRRRSGYVPWFDEL